MQPAAPAAERRNATEPRLPYELRELINCIAVQNLIRTALRLSIPIERSPTEKDHVADEVYFLVRGMLLVEPACTGAGPLQQFSDAPFKALSQLHAHINRYFDMAAANLKERRMRKTHDNEREVHLRIEWLKLHRRILHHTRFTADYDWRMADLVRWIETRVLPDSLMNQRFRREDWRAAADVDEWVYDMLLTVEMALFEVGAWYDQSTRRWSRGQGRSQ